MRDQELTKGAIVYIIMSNIETPCGGRKDSTSSFSAPARSKFNDAAAFAEWGHLAEAI